MTEANLKSENSIAVIDGPKGSAEIFEYIVRDTIEYAVRFNNEAKTYVSLGEAYLIADELVGKTH
jgi:hypothetical protein